ncbi:CidA/LrgA family protein [Billgrantia endophytica]|uniref:CidA/LrgA family protein n=1 Tax=Billgrantia endophytica TaxID=2033802 RepID=A0A2N7U9M1_9GAMM|nr:CidA/LrgA family protein [Halomonas endophytica]PMR77130.1 CidA/LrgA family protein [Halomonas endophytica]
MSSVRGFLWLVGFLLLGEALVWLLPLPVSPGVVGMLTMTLWLMLRGRVGEDIQAASQPLIAVLAMLIMPGVVGVFFVTDEFAGQWLIIGVALVLGTLLSVATTLWLMQRFMPKADPGE